MSIDDLTNGFASLASRSAKLRSDVQADLEDQPALRKYLEINPINAWTGGKGTGGTAYFAYEEG